MCTWAVFHDEGDGGVGLSFGDEERFEIGVGDHHVGGSEGAILVGGVDGAAAHIDLSVLFGPFPDFVFEGLPDALVQVAVLGTDVGVVEALRHGDGVPFHVAGGSQVSSMPPASFIIIIGGLVTLDVGVGHEIVGPGPITFKFLLGEFVGDPIGGVGVLVKAQSVSMVVNDLLLFADGGAFHEVRDALAGATREPCEDQ